MIHLQHFIPGEKTIETGLFVGLVALNEDGVIVAGIDDPVNPPYYIVGANVGVGNGRRFIHIITNWIGWTIVAKTGKDYKAISPIYNSDYQLTTGDLEAIKKRVAETKTPYIGTEYCKIHDALDDLAYQQTMHFAVTAIINNRGIITNPT